MRWSCFTPNRTELRHWENVPCLIEQCSVYIREHSKCWGLRVIHVQLALIEGVGRGEGIEGAIAHEQGESDSKRFPNYWVYN